MSAARGRASEEREERETAGPAAAACGRAELGGGSEAPGVSAPGSGGGRD